MSTVPVEPVPSVFPVRRPPPPASAGLAHWLGLLAFVLLHVGCLAVWFTGADGAALLLCGACYLVHMVGITAGYHRYFSHRSYKTSRPFQFVLACLGCSALQKGPLWWAGHHRDHHRHADTARDVHSPLTATFWWSHVGWILAPDYNRTNWVAVRDWSRYPELRWLNRYHWVPPLLLAALCYLVGGWGGLVWGGVVSTVLSYHATFAINSLSHLVGRRRYATADASRNNMALAVITLGEGWHNNHHYYQSSARQGFFWWEIDLTYYLIRLLGAVGLVWDIRRPPADRKAARGGRGADSRPRDRAGPRAQAWDTAGAPASVPHPGRPTARPWPPAGDSPRPRRRRLGMTGAARQGPRRGWWAWWGDLIQRGLLGKSAPGYMRRFTGDDAYWAAALAAQERCASAADGGPRGAEAQGAGDPTAARGPDPAGRRPVMPPASPAEPGAAPP